MQVCKQKEFRDLDGTILIVKFTNSVARLETNGKRCVEVSVQAARWLVGEMEQEFGLISSNAMDTDHIYFFTGEVEEASVLEAQRELMKMASRLKTKRGVDNPSLTIVFNSPGGYCIDGFALYDIIELIRGMGVQVIGIVMGGAYSMASCLLQSCTIRLVARHARLMIHEVAGEMGGKLNDIHADMGNLIAINDIQAKCFAERNTKGYSDSKFWIEYTSGRDKYISAEEAVELGVADAVYNPMNICDASKYLV